MTLSLHVIKLLENHGVTEQPQDRSYLQDERKEAGSNFLAWTIKRAYMAVGVSQGVTYS